MSMKILLNWQGECCKMVKTHKRAKNSRIRGARTVGWGFRQKHKGHGNKGGFGMAGTGKKADHKKQSAEQSVKD